TWEAAADALEQALAPVLHEARTRNVDFAIEHTNPLRVDVGFVHTLRDAIDLARRLDTGVCMEMNARWQRRSAMASTASASYRSATSRSGPSRPRNVSFPATETSRSNASWVSS